MFNLKRTKIMAYIVFTQLVDEDEHYIETDNRELEVMVALHADQTSDDPAYQDDWPGWDGETKSYYIADPDVLHRLADQYGVAVEILEV
jgi:hypothetical protein